MSYHSTPENRHFGSRFTSVDAEILMSPKWILILQLFPVFLTLISRFLHAPPIDMKLAPKCLFSRVLWYDIEFYSRGVQKKSENQNYPPPLLPRAHVQRVKQLVLSAVIVVTKIARSRVLHICACCNYHEFIIGRYRRKTGFCALGIAEHGSLVLQIVHFFVQHVCRVPAPPIPYHVLTWLNCTCSTSMHVRVAKSWSAYSYIYSSEWSAAILLYNGWRVHGVCAFESCVLRKDLIERITMAWFIILLFFPCIPPMVLEEVNIWKFSYRDPTLIVYCCTRSSMGYAPLMKANNLKQARIALGLNICIWQCSVWSSPLFYCAHT